MTLLRDTKDLCEKYNIKPAHSRGQNFLINSEVYHTILETAELKKTDTVLEVGPGLGWLTSWLAESVKQVVAVEVDQKLAKILVRRLTEEKVQNVSIINADILDWPNINKPGTTEKIKLPVNYKIVANLPYNITSIFLRKFLESEAKPTTLTLMLQKEVAERITAKPGDLSLLGLSVQFYAEVKFIIKVNKEDFWPAPEVQSAVVHLKTKTKLPLPDDKIKDFFRLLKFGFGAKRKMLKNNLTNNLKLEMTTVEKCFSELGLPLTCRAQELSLDSWISLFYLINKR